MSQNSWPQTDDVGSPNVSNDTPEGQVQDSSYATKDLDEPIPVLKDDDAIEDPIRPQDADSEKTLGQDEREAIDRSNILNDRTRHAKPDGSYKVDEEEDVASLE